MAAKPRRLRGAEGSVSRIVLAEVGSESIVCISLVAPQEARARPLDATRRRLPDAGAPRVPRATARILGRKAGAECRAPQSLRGRARLAPGMGRAGHTVERM